MNQNNNYSTPNMGGQCPNPPQANDVLLPTVTARAAAYALFWLFFWVDSVFSIFISGRLLPVS